MQFFVGVTGDGYNNQHTLLLSDCNREVKMHLFNTSLLNNLGVLCLNLKEVDDSEKYLKDALRLFLKFYGEESLNTASCLEYLGTVNNNKQNYEVAEKFYNRALKTYIKLYGDNDQNIHRIKR